MQGEPISEGKRNGSPPSRWGQGKYERSKSMSEEDVIDYIIQAFRLCDEEAIWANEEEANTARDIAIRAVKEQEHE